jgi:hypothetical protein
VVVVVVVVSVFVVVVHDDNNFEQKLVNRDNVDDVKPDKRYQRVCS